MQCVDLIEHRAVTKFAPGRNPAIKVIRLTLDPVRVYSRPLILYVFVWLATKAVTVNSKRHGFKEVRDDNTRCAALSSAHCVAACDLADRHYFLGTSFGFRKAGSLTRTRRRPGAPSCLSTASGWAWPSTPPSSTTFGPIRP